MDDTISVPIRALLKGLYAAKVIDRDQAKIIVDAIATAEPGHRHEANHIGLAKDIADDLKVARPDGYVGYGADY